MKHEDQLFDEIATIETKIIRLREKADDVRCIIKARREQAKKAFERRRGRAVHLAATTNSTYVTIARKVGGSPQTIPHHIYMWLMFWDAGYAKGVCGQSDNVRDYLKSNYQKILTLKGLA